jgi:alpha-tubulin suppressor-like RCC1 family protein
MILNNWLLSIQKTDNAVIPTSLYTFGLNNVGQLGYGTTIDSQSPVKVGLESWKKISSGLSHTVGLLSNNRLYAWGLNTSGQLGDGTTLSKSSPVVIGTGTWNDVSAGAFHTAAIAANNKLFTWGNNQQSQLGDGTIISRSSPVIIGDSSWSAVSAGWSHTAAVLANGSMFAWGLAMHFGEDQFVRGSNYNSPVAIQSTEFFTQVSAGAANLLGLDASGRIWSSGPIGTPGNYWNEIAIGSDHVLALRSDGSLFAWGDNAFGQLGDTTLFKRSAPVKIGPSSWAAIGAAGNTSYAIRGDGSLFAWGNATGGEIGDSTVVRSIFDDAQGSYSWIKIEGGGSAGGISGNQIMALTSTGRLWGWGNNTQGTLGDGTTVFKSNPVNIGLGIGHDTTFIDFSAADGHTCAITSNGALYCWGNGVAGNLGDGTTISKSSPVKIGNQSWQKVFAALGSCTYAIHANGALFAWGTNSFGQLGINDFVSRSSPVQIVAGVGAAEGSWSTVAPGVSVVAAISSTGNLYTWGVNSISGTGSGALGIGLTNDISGNPSWPLTNFTYSYTQIAATGFGTVFGIIGNPGPNQNRLHAFGFSGSTGILGDGTTVSKSSPVLITADGGQRTFTKVVGKHGSAAAAIGTNGILYTWGSSLNGEGGRGFTFAVSLPSAVGALNSWSDVSMNPASCGAILSNGALFMWGLGNSGNLGDGTTISKSSPVKIGNQSWQKVAGTLLATAAIHANGALYTWGSGETVGSNSVARSSPVQLGTDSWITVEAGIEHFLAIRSDGALFAWGNNRFGMLGDGTTTSKSSPIQIGSESWSQVHAAGFISSGKYANDSINLYSWGFDYRTPSDSSTHFKSSPVFLGAFRAEFFPTANGNLGGFTDARVICNTNGEIVAWGNNLAGQLGTGVTRPLNTGIKSGILVYNASSYRAYPELLMSRGDHLSIPTISSSWSLANASNYLFHAIRSNGELWAWGLNGAAGALGDGTTISKSSPVKIGSESWITVQSGTPNSTHTAGVLAIHANGALYAWGNNAIGQLGDGTTINKSSPVKIGASSWTTIGGGTQVRAAAIGSDLYTWGLGPVRGNVASVINVSSPVVVGPASYRISPIKIGSQSWTRVAAGFSYAIGLLANGQIYGWGVNGSGQLGNGTTAGTSSPVFSSITSGINWAQITASEQTGYARASNGAIYSWGGGALGQLGDGTTVTKSSLVKIGAESWSSITAGGSHIVGLLANNKLAAWGLNSSGQLGDGTTLNKSSPVVIGSESWSFATAGVNTAQAVHANGALFSWGNNVFGQLGIGLTTNRSSPTQVGTSPTFWKSALSDTGPFGLSIMISKSGTIVSAGYNNNGAMGDGTTL